MTSKTKADKKRKVGIDALKAEIKKKKEELAQLENRRVLLMFPDDDAELSQTADTIEATLFTENVSTLSPNMFDRESDVNETEQTGSNPSLENDVNETQTGSQSQQ